MATKNILDLSGNIWAAGRCDRAVAQRVWRVNWASPAVRPSLWAEGCGDVAKIYAGKWLHGRGADGLLHAAGEQPHPQAICVKIREIRHPLSEPMRITLETIGAVQHVL